MIRTLFIVLLMFCSPIFATEPAQETSQDAPTMIRKDEWANSVREQLPKELCQPSSDFVTCYEIDIFDCFNMAHSIVDACINSLNKHMPETFTQEEGKKWGGFAGRCAFDVYTTINQKNLKDPLCDSFQKLEAEKQTPNENQKKQ